MQQLHFSAMGCQMLAAIDTDSPRGGRLLRQAPRWFAAWEQCLSRFRPDSELSLLNAAAGQPTRVSETLWRALRAAQRSAAESDGRVIPTVLSALEAAGYDQNFADIGTNASSSSAIPTVAALSSVVLDADTRTVTLHDGARLDLGGVAKGWAADLAAHRLGRIAPALVDAGGDIAIAGPSSGTRCLPVGVADPFDPNRQLALLRLGCGGVATSGRDYRRWQRNGQWQHHIVDPRTGRPAETDVLTATVVASSAREAEAAAKAALILGGQDGLAWIDARPGLAALLVRENGDVLTSKRFDRFIWR